MTIMQQSSKAQDRALGVWYQLIDQGSIKLPRFQRPEAWERGRITSFLNTVINNLPVGVTLALEVAGAEKFVSRYIATAERDGVSAVTQHLLDGQQRLTAFWRAMHNNYEWETFYVHLPAFDQTEGSEKSDDPDVQCVTRWLNKNDLRMPRWAEDPAKCMARGLIPIHLLCPGDRGREIDVWLKAALEPIAPIEGEVDAIARFQNHAELREKIKDEIVALRERVTHFNLPYLSLPSSTEKDIALQVFTNMNTNSKPLAQYDIIVAEVEAATGESLPDWVASLQDICSNAMRFGDVKNLVLSTSALLQGQLPNNRGTMDMDRSVMLTNWPKLERGLERMAALLASQGVFDEKRLPTGAVLPVIAAAYDLVPDNGDFLAKAEKLLRRYLWSSFFTDRYENTAASRAFNDFRAIKALLQNPAFTDDDLKTVPVLNRTEFPLADVDSLMVVGWPRGVGIRARGVVAVTTYFGAYDFADEKKAAHDNVRQREYHHVFPDALLKEADIESFRALNCAFITWKTNRIIGRKDPLDYLAQRVEFSDVQTVRQRLRSHLISYDLLAKAAYGDATGDALATRLGSDFGGFLRDRGERVAAAAMALANGEQPSLEAIWSQVPEEAELQPGGNVE